MMVFLFFKIGQFLWEISLVFTVDLNIAKIVRDDGKEENEERSKRRRQK